VSDNIQAITMPKWGLSMEEGMVVAWLAEEGNSIDIGQDILEIETTKITNVYEAPAAGFLRRQVVAEGETVPVGTLLGLLAEPSVPESELDSFIESFNADFAIKATEVQDAAPEPQSVTAGGLTLNYLRMGADGRTPLVLIHGFGGDLNNWLFNQTALAENFDVLALDLPGHGRSSKEVGGANLASLTATFGAFLNAVGIERAHLVGHSLGGALALLFAIDNPRRVTGLTLLAPVGLAPEINMEFVEGFIAAERRKEMRSVLEHLVAAPELISRDMVNDVLKYKRLDGVADSLKRLSEGLFPGGRQKTLDLDRLAELAIPICVIWGKDDRILPAAHADNLPEKVEIHRLEGVGHMPHMEASAEINRLIESSMAVPSVYSIRSSDRGQLQ
jgi:pyruvate dehydrogenase E2 component (dihydrolipoamide acetyltransferase)